MQVTVVTLLVNPGAVGTPGAREHRRQDSARRCATRMDQGAPATPGIKTAGLMGAVAAPARSRLRLATAAVVAPQPAQPVTQTAPAPAPMPTVEMIRGDKRASEVIR